MRLTLNGRLVQCALLAYRTPQNAVQHLVPDELELMTRGGWAFWNIVGCRVESLRMAGLPRGCGVDCQYVGYRLYVRRRGIDDAETNGLFFVRSETDNGLLAFLGNRVSDFRFRWERISFQAGARRIAFRVGPRGAGGILEAFETDSVEPFESPCFDSHEEAARILKYRPVGFAVRGHRVRLAEVVRDERAWRETALHIERAQWTFLEKHGPIHLEIATRVAPIEYRWRLH